MGWMAVNEKITRADLSSLKVLYFPDPHLREGCTPVEVVDASVRALVERMFELMFESRGVGLAGSQVGVSVRLFIASPTFSPEDRRVYINPRIVAAEGTQEGDEGCLSFPSIYTKVKRHGKVTIRAQNLKGEWFEETADALAARILEHEIDHLDGRLLVDRMGTVAKLAHRKAIHQLEEAFAGKNDK